MSSSSENNNFIMKMYTLFDPKFIKSNNWESIYGWYDTRTIMFKDINLFLSKCAINTFKLTKKESFYRQLHLYGFRKVRDIPENMVFKNDLFVKNMKVDDVFKIKRITLVKRTILNDNDSVTSSECSLKMEETIVPSKYRRSKRKIDVNKLGKTDVKTDYKISRRITRSSKVKSENEIDIESVNLGSKFTLTLFDNKSKKDEQSTDEEFGSIDCFDVSKDNNNRFFEDSELSNDSSEFDNLLFNVDIDKSINHEDNSYKDLSDNELLLDFDNNLDIELIVN